MADPLERLVDRALDPASTAAPDQTAERPEFRGEALDGRVRAVVSGDGHVRTVSLEPDVLRLPLAEVAAAARDAINAALAARPGRADLSPLVELLTRVREQARAELAVVSTGFQDVEAGVRAVRSAQQAQQQAQRQMQRGAS